MAITALLVAACAGTAPAAASAESGDLLPDLIAMEATRVSIGGVPIGVLGGFVGVNGCFLDEMIEQGARRCMRFDQGIGNLGNGPFELAYSVTQYASDPHMYQRIYRADGTIRERKAEQYEFHPAHAHFHYKGFAQSHLWRSNEMGQRIGFAPAKTGRKNGFCVVDVERLAGSNPPEYGMEDCDAAEPHLNGITAGWADIYSAELPDQYIEVSGLEDGFYLLETVADPDSTIVELSDANNSAQTLIKVEGDDVRQVTPTRASGPRRPVTRREALVRSGERWRATVRRKVAKVKRVKPRARRPARHRHR